MSVGGKNTSWGHGTHGALSSITDFSAKTMSFDGEFNAEEADSTTFGTGNRSYEATFENAAFSFQYKYDTTVWGQVTAIFQGRDSVNFELGPDGTTSGYAKVTGAFVITKVGLPITVANILVIPVSARLNGTPTFTTY